MYKYSLPNGAVIDIDRVVDAVLVEGDFPQMYLDTETAALIEISSKDNLRRWVEKNKSAKKHLLIEHFTDNDRDSMASDFIRIVLQDVSPKDVLGAQKVLAESGWQAFEAFLEEQTDGWIHAWDQYIGDEAWEYAHNWLTQNPYVSIKAEFEGCGNCAICKLMSAGDDKDMGKLLSAFATENIVHNIEKQMQTLPKKQPAKKKKKAQAKKSSTAGKVFSFKITLNDSKPNIWRRILVPADYTFFELHCAIQDAMGWANSHLHSFRIDTRSQLKSKRTSENIDITYIQLPNPDMDDWEPFGTDKKDERTEKIADWFPKRIKQCVYEYDFGDGWEHTIRFERELERDPNTHYPQCAAGKNACPPEDCGGIGGYDRLQKILTDPKHKEYDNILEWFGLESADEFDPSHFNPEEVVFDDPKLVLKEYEEWFGK